MSGLSARDDGASNENWENSQDPMYRTTSIEDEKVIEENQFKASLSEIQKQSIDRSIESRYLSKQQASGTGIPIVHHDSSTAKSWLRNNGSPTSEHVGPAAAAPIQHTHVDAKILKKTCESKSRFELFMDKITAPFHKKDKTEV